MGLEVIWLGHASFRLEGDGKVVYIDPWKIAPASPKADIILITHDHFDHNSPEDVEKLRKADTVIVGPRDVITKYTGSTQSVSPGSKLEIGGVEIEAIPAYNIGKQFHPKANNWVGYIVSLAGERVYHTGDSDAIPEGAGLQVDYALVPVGGTYTMNAREAAEFVKRMQVKVAIPMHWGDIIGSQADVQEFARLLEGSGVEVRILEPSS